MRLDAFLAGRFPQFSRAKIQRAIVHGQAHLNGSACKSSFRISTGQSIRFEIPREESEVPIGEDIPLDIVHEDPHIIGINKPAGMVVHPAKGHWSGTLTAALAFHFKTLSSLGGETRPGIVHRLDRDTSGIIIVAKTDAAHAGLARQFENRTVEKTYLAIVSPPPNRDRDEINAPIGSHPYQREKMAIRSGHPSSRAASTFYEIIESHDRYSLLSVTPKTGRTHQIRVHLAHIGCPVLCDRLYSGRSQITGREIGIQDAGNSAQIALESIVLARQALHAKSVRFCHPVSQQSLQLDAPLAPEIDAAWKLIVAARH